MYSRMHYYNEIICFVLCVRSVTCLCQMGWWRWRRARRGWCRLRRPWSSESFRLAETYLTSTRSGRSVSLEVSNLLLFNIRLSMKAMISWSSFRFFFALWKLGKLVLAQGKFSVAIFDLVKDYWSRYLISARQKISADAYLLNSSGFQGPGKEVVFFLITILSKNYNEASRTTTTTILSKNYNYSFSKRVEPNISSDHRINDKKWNNSYQSTAIVSLCQFSLTIWFLIAALAISKLRLYWCSKSEQFLVWAIGFSSWKMG